MRELVLIPQPKRIAVTEGSFTLNLVTSIVLPAGSGESEFFAARTLQQEIAENTGMQLPILALSTPLQTQSIILASNAEALAAFLGHDLPVTESAVKGRQGYSIWIHQDIVIACGNSAQGLFYAAQTLRQVTRVMADSWPCAVIADWPSLADRGLMMDVSRGKVPTLETIKLVIDQLSLYKMNVLQFYTEHTFRFPHHPRIGQDCGSLTAEDILELDAYARPRYIELMPNLQSFGHCEHILNLPEYTPLAESAAHWSLCPVDERTYVFIDELYGDMLPAFSSRTLNIGCDETFDLGKGRSRELVQEIGLGRVYLGHILRLREIAAKYGCRIQLWGDILLHHPELVSELPEDVTLLDWHYEAADDYPSTKLFGESGHPFWVCPGTSSWNTLFPRIDNANGNIRTLARVGVANGASGMLNTDWGDGGHYQPIGQCWYGYLYGAEQAWTGGETEDNQFDRNFGRLFFGCEGEQVSAAMRELGKFNTLPGMARPNASYSIFALLDEPLAGTAADELPVATTDAILRVCSQVETRLRGVYANVCDKYSLEELLYTTRLYAYTARKNNASRTARQILQSLPSRSDEALSALAQIDSVFAGLEGELPNLVDEFRSQWFRRARNSEIRITLNHFAKLQARYAVARTWLAELANAIRAGNAPDGSLEAYTREAAGYEILYQGWARHLREIGITWE